MVNMKIPCAVIIALALTGCANPLFDVGQTETVLPLSRAWVDGRIVEYITTDISDLAMAQMMGANYVPRLRDALGSQARNSLVERVYKFPGNEQISIFQSAPTPIGPDNKDRAYSPLWRVTEVKWIMTSGFRVLKSEEELLVARDKGEVSVIDTEIVVNCPVTRDINKYPLRGVR